MSNETKDRLLGQSFGSASNRLRKLIMWTLVCKTDQNVCFRCEQRIEDIDDLSIEHKEPWQGADDPKAAFFDLTNIAFSHLRCNVGAGHRPNKVYASGQERKTAEWKRYYGRSKDTILRRKRERYNRV